ncbi:MAG: hypothetical protein IKL29_08725 [Bacteroidaceae bacterium]|nr:hypothetical protein [Bacteroidaceae bacterium]
MTNIVLNEKACAEHAIANLTLGSKPIETLGRVARYYYSEGYKKREIGSLLEDFMLKCDPTINIVKWQATIDRQVNSADKYELIDIPGVAVTKSEMEQIKKIEGKLLQRLMFTMLCLAKYGNAINPNNNSWVNRKDKEIFSLANITITTKRQSLMINDLWTLGYIGYSRVVDNININVKIIDDESPVELFVTDFRNLGNQYMRYCGEKYIECQCCGVVIRKDSNVQRYCRDCAAEINRQKTLENWRKSASS